MNYSIDILEIQLYLDLARLESVFKLRHTFSSARTPRVRIRLLIAEIRCIRKSLKLLKDAK